VNRFILFFDNLLQLSVEASPWLLFGLLIAGLIKAWVPTKILSPHFCHGNKTIINVVFIGAPLPLCLCGVSPVATELKRLRALVFIVAGPATHISTLGVSKMR
jgi:uncharacterized membrane protein YraQ (UPF0718 family)